MKNLRFLLLAASFALALGACSKKPELDATNAQTLKQSSEVIRNSLTPEQRVRYDSAVTMIVVATLDPMQTLDLADKGTLPTQAGVIERLRPVIDGLDADEILSLGVKSKAKVEQQLAVWKQEHQALQTRYAAYEASIAKAQMVKPVGANLRTLDSRVPLFGENQVEVDVTLQNGLDTPVTEVSFDLGLMPPGVPNPWVVQPFSKRFDKPLAPGASATVTVGPIVITIPEVYKGPVELEADIQIKSVGQQGGKGSVTVPKWDQLNTMRLAKLETSITEISAVLKQLEGLRA